MNRSFKFYCTAGAQGHGNWMVPIGGEVTNILEDADVLILGGGADVDPATYGDKPSHGTYIDRRREAVEVADFKRAQQLGKKVMGICRGQQLLCALAGGKLIQDVTNHAGADHSMSTFDDQRIVTNSLHHQMINPYVLKPNEYKILAWSTKRLSSYYMGGGNKKIYLPADFKEIEAIIFPKINAFAVQYHPEMLYRSDRRIPAIEWTQNAFLQFMEGII